MVGSIIIIIPATDSFITSKKKSMKYKFLNLTALFALVITLFMSCIKDDIQELGDSGHTFIKFQEAPENKLYFSPFTNIDTLDLFSTRKDANSSSSFNTPTTVTLTSMPELIDTFNYNNNSSFEPLPDSLFTLLNAAFTKTATGYTVNFASGDFARDFTIALNGAKWNVSHTYALAFSLAAAGDNIALASAKDTIMVFLSVKNKYDGKYTVTGSLTDNVVATISGWYPWDCEFQTSGPNSVVVFDPYWPGIYHAIKSGTDRSVYGNFGLEITFDPVTNNVVSIINVYGQPAPNTRAVLMDAGNTYHWDESSKTMDVKYFMTQTSLVPDPPYIRTTYIENYKYTGPR
jgi:Domain of unknown function (DUF1735)